MLNIFVYNNLLIFSIQGDGGSALVSENHIIGIVSVFTVSTVGAPAAYDSDFFYQNWINNMMRKF